MAAGEGIETMLSLRSIMTTLPMTAGSRQPHLAALQPPPALRRLYIARDLDSCRPHRDGASGRPAREPASKALVLSSRCGDFNDDLRRFASTGLRGTCARNSRPEDFSRCTGRISGRKREMRPDSPGYRAAPVRKGSRLAGKDRATASEWATDAAKRTGPATAVGNYFPPRPADDALHRETK